jgi:hypothetical protein
VQGKATRRYAFGYGSVAHAFMQMAHKSGSSFFIIARDNGSVTKVYNPTEKLDDPNFEWVCAQIIFV